MRYENIFRILYIFMLSAGTTMLFFGEINIILSSFATLFSLGVNIAYNTHKNNRQLITW